MKQVAFPLFLATAVWAVGSTGLTEEPVRFEPATTNVRGAAYLRFDRR